MLLLLLTAAAYFYYHWQYFLLVSDVQKLPYPRRGLVILGFFANYLFFIVCSILEFHLVLNWLLFAFLLFFETLFYYKGDKRSALFHTLTGIIYGLASNIFCRSIMAILIHQPMHNFDNHTLSSGNIKGIPVLIGFVLAGIILRFMRTPVIIRRFRLILDHPRHYSFILEMMTGLFFYLFINLLLYSATLNDLVLKIWSIKSCVFSAAGFYIAIRYTWRICELDDYRDTNRKMEVKLKEQKLEEERLKHQAALEPMTGLYNRQYAEETIASMMEQKMPFTLCFLDLDGLKKVNDAFGHEEGDRYILTTTGEISSACRNRVDSLYRYGGDEFLVLFRNMTADTAGKRAEIINERLRAAAADKALPYSMSVSYGIVESSEGSDWRLLLREADRRMYRQKQEKGAAREFYADKCGNSDKENEGKDGVNETDIFG